MKKSAESIHKVWTMNICHLVQFGGRFGTNVKSPDMGLEKRTRGALGVNWGARYGYLGPSISQPSPKYRDDNNL
jgi:hypothetical protein